jgi:hypothetical protein
MNKKENSLHNTRRFMAITPLRQLLPPSCVNCA